MLRIFLDHHILRIILIIFSLSLCVSASNGINKNKFVIVLDAGHGGKDPGTLGTKKLSVYEKDVVLDVALLTGKILETKNPNIQVVYTRKNDEFIELQERADFANANKADLFVSIHCNSAESPKAYGASSYVLGLHKDTESFEVAKRENAVMMLEEDYQTKYKGFNPNSNEDIIAMTLQQSEHMQNSIILSDLIQRSLESNKRKNRGVHQAGFWVLHQSSMPSILVELGFLTNPKEEKYLHSQRGKTKLSDALSSAILSYVNMIMPAKQAVENIVSNANLAVNKPAPTAKTPKWNKPAPKKTPKATITPQPKTNIVSNASILDDETISIHYRIQLFAISRKIDYNAPEFKGYKNISHTQENKLFKYYYGKFSDQTKARAELSKMREAHFKGAFLVKFKGDQKI